MLKFGEFDEHFWTNINKDILSRDFDINTLINILFIASSSGNRNKIFWINVVKHIKKI